MRKYNLNIISEETASLNAKTCESFLVKISNEELVLKFNQKIEFKIYGWISVIITLFLFISSFNELKDYWILMTFLSLISILFLSLGYLITRKNWILNRKLQKISIPLNLKKKPSVKSIYNIKSGYYVQTGGTSGVSTIVPVVWHESKLAFRNTSSLTTLYYPKNESDTARTWSFYIWYLDKNRPLPPGDLLDPFREEDFKRRKADGFPPPLFCSCIPTPEATPEQQAEREKYWKDEDYMFRLDRYKEPKLWSGFTGSNTPLKMEKEATLISKGRNPNNWELKPYPEFENFKYLPTAYAMRYEFDDGKIVYSIIVQQTGLVCTPPSKLSYKKEIIR